VLPCPGVDAAVNVMGALEGVVAIGPPFANDAGTTAVFQVVPNSGPSAQATKDLVAEIRDTAAAAAGESGAKLYVTGPTAIDIDMTASSTPRSCPTWLSSWDSRSSFSSSCSARS